MMKKAKKQESPNRWVRDPDKQEYWRYQISDAHVASQRFERSRILQRAGSRRDIILP